MIKSVVKYGEIAGLIISGCSVIFKTLHLSGASQLLMIGFLTLSAVYFLTAFTYPQRVVVSVGQAKFSDQLVLILNKLMFIGMSVLMVGFLFTFLHMPGANEMILIGLMTVAFCVLCSMVLILLNRDKMKELQPALIRSIILIVFYFAIPLLR